MDDIALIGTILAFSSLHGMQESVKPDHVLYTSNSSLKQKCLIVLAKSKAPTESLPKEDLAQGLETLKKLHSSPIDSLTPQEIKSAFDVCASSESKQKVDLINTKKIKPRNA